MMNRTFTAALAAVVISTGCASTGSPQATSSGDAPERTHKGKVVGTAGGAVAGGAIGYSSAGILCTIGGPLCMVFVIPAAIVGGLVGLAAGAAVDAVGPPATDAAAAPREGSAPPPGG